MWRSATSLVVGRRLPQQRAVVSLAFTRKPRNLVFANNTKLMGMTANRYGCHPFASSSNDGNNGSGKNEVDGNHYQDDDDDDDDEGWIPPVRGPGSDGIDSGGGTTTSSVPKSKRLETIIEVSRQVKEHERVDRALEEIKKEAEALLQLSDEDLQQEADALFQLSEEEVATLSDEKILERLDEVLKREEELEEQIFQKELEREEASKQQLAGDDQQQPEAPDWGRNRRAMLGEDKDGESTSSSTSAVPIIHHTRLTADEIKLLLEAHGGGDIVVVEDDPEAPRMGGTDGMIFCTGGGSSGSSGKDNSKSKYLNSSPHLISTLSRVLIDHMKDRKLHELGTAPSAQQNTTNRAAMSAPTIFGNLSGRSNPSESWRIVDCGNYIVHILDEATRWDLNLEDLWSGADPLWKLNVFDEDAVEDYCQKHPVPESFNGTGSRSGLSYGEDEETGYVDVAAIRRLERTRFGQSRRHKPVISQARKNRDRRIGKKKERERRERDYSESYGSYD